MGPETGAPNHSSKVIRIFLNEESLMRLTGTVLMERNEKIASIRRASKTSAYQELKLHTPCMRLRAGRNAAEKVRKYRKPMKKAQKRYVLTLHESLRRQKRRRKSENVS